MCQSFCSPLCPDGQYECPMDYDSSGCPMPPTCSCSNETCPKSHDWRGCPITPFPACNEGEQTCANGADDRGCHQGFSCLPAMSPCPTPSLPAPTLPWNLFVTKNSIASIHLKWFTRCTLLLLCTQYWIITWNLLSLYIIFMLLE